MYKIAIALLLAATAAVAQAAPPQATSTPRSFSSNLVEKRQGPTYSDINCAGFVTPEIIPIKDLVLAGERAPNATRFGTGDVIYLTGPGITVGQKYRLVRRVKDPNKNELFPGQQKLLKKMGGMYADLGIVKVNYIDHDIAIAKVEFSCESIVPGDLVIPFVDRPAPVFSQSASDFQKFAVPKSDITGQIAMAKDFDSFVATGAKVYLNIGSNEGLKPGEYLRVTRGYDPAKEAPIDKLSEKASVWEDTQHKMPSPTPKALAYLPHRGIGEIMVLSVTPTTATGMVILTLEDMHLGDQVEVPVTH